jgi:hypothetical protein
VIETHEENDHFVERKPVSASPALFSTEAGSGFMKDLVRELHMSPEAQEEIERKIGQSLPRSGLTS